MHPPLAADKHQDAPLWRYGVQTPKHTWFIPVSLIPRRIMQTIGFTGLEVRNSDCFLQLKTTFLL